MAWIATLLNIIPQDSGSNVVVTISYDDDVTQENQVQSASFRTFDMKDAVNLAVTVVAELDRRDTIIAQFKDINDAIGAGKKFILAQSIPAITVADGT